MASCTLLRSDKCWTFPEGKYINTLCTAIEWWYVRWMMMFFSFPKCAHFCKLKTCTCLYVFMHMSCKMHTYMCVCTYLCINPSNLSYDSALKTRHLHLFAWNSSYYVIAMNWNPHFSHFLNTLLSNTWQKCYGVGNEKHMTPLLLVWYALGLISFLPAHL